jgi:DNA-binding MarR family transcriptional regulator
MSNTTPTSGVTLEDEVLDPLVQTSFRVMSILSSVGSTHDLSTTQVRLLGILRDREPKMAELADHLGLDKSSISGLIDRAEKRGLVKRRASPDDGRTVHVALTAAGRRLVGVASKQIRSEVAHFASALSATEQRRLGTLLSTLTSAS